VDAGGGSGGGETFVAIVGILLVGAEKKIGPILLQGIFSNTFRDFGN
jgi:hypothetical protein